MPIYIISYNMVVEKEKSSNDLRQNARNSKGVIMNCDFTIYDMIARNAVLYPERIALVNGGRRTTYGGFKQQCDQCAGGLAAAGLAAGDRIAVLSGNCDDFMILYGAAAKIGVIVVPINTRLGEAEVTYALQDTTPLCLISAKEHREAAQRAAMRTASIQKHYAFGDDDVQGDTFPFRSLLLEGGSDVSGTVSGDAPCLIIHTAAVGGSPRGSVLTQTNLLTCGLQISHLLELGNRDCYLGLLPLFHIGGIAMTLATIMTGGKTVLVERFDPSAVPGLIAGEKGTFFVTFPPMLTAILDAQEKAALDLSILRAGCGVDSPETIERFLKANPQAAFYSLYGQTEAMPVSGCNYRKRPGSIGNPAILTRVALFDDLDRAVPAETPGEICVRSPAVFQGYWNLPEETAYAFRNGWHHTGDLGRIDADGFLWYAGRKPEKELIKPGGENVYPAEVEKVILEHSAIQEVCVIGVPDRQWGEAVKAVCVLKQGRLASAEELIDFVASRIARYKKPKHVLFVDDLPKTAGGAIDRELVKKAWGSES
ncbi:MAG: AMP-binding protein [Pseudomonadota bacterium]